MSATRHDRGVGKFIDAVLSEFGTEWTQLTIVFGVVISVMDLKLDPGIWVLGTALSFLICYLFRRSIGGRFALTVFGGIALAFTAWLLLEAFWAELSTQIEEGNRRKVWTLLMSMLVALPIGFAILSYRKQEHFRIVPLPRALSDNVARQIDHAEVLYCDVEYNIWIEQPKSLQDSGEVKITFQMKFKMVNRKRTTIEHEVEIDPAHKSDLAFHHLLIDDVALDTEDKKIEYGHGLKPKIPLKPGESATLDVKASAILAEIGSESYSTYMPADRLKITIAKVPSSLNVQVVEWTSLKVDSQVNDDVRIYSFPQGVLPFQGIRLMWFPR